MIVALVVTVDLVSLVQPNTQNKPKQPVNILVRP
jgi:hypothetical protein